MRRAALFFLLSSAAAQAQPNLGKQEAWGEKEKKEFLQYLRQGQGAPLPEGQVKSVRLAGGENGPAAPRKPRYLSVSLFTDTLMPVAGNGAVRREGSGLGPKILAGGHVFTWMRYYAGIQGCRFRQETLDGSRALVTHLQFPAGIEVALIPLGTPHTRYLLLRGGAALHSFSSPGHAADDFHAPLPGWQTTLNAGLGYEWQIPDTRWRLNALVEGYKYLSRRGSTARFYGLGFTAGTVYTF